MDKYYQTQKVPKKSEPLREETLKPDIMFKPKELVPDKEFAVFVFDFVYNFLFNEMINKKDNTFEIYENESENVKKTFFVQTLLKFINKGNTKANFHEDASLFDHLIFKEFNSVLICEFNTHIYWKTEHKVYQFKFELSSEVNKTLIPNIHSVIILLDENNIVKDITVFEIPKFGDNPIVKQLTNSGHNVISSNLYFENDFEIKIENFNLYNDDFIDALYRYFVHSDLI